MNWLPARKASAWIWIALVIALVQFAVIGLSVHYLLPTANLKYLNIAVFCLATGAVIGGSGWLGSRWFSLFSLLGLAIGLPVMAYSFVGTTGWEELAGVISLILFQGGGAVIGLLVELGAWAFRAKRS